MQLYSVAMVCLISGICGVFSVVLYDEGQNNKITLASFRALSVPLPNLSPQNTQKVLDNTATYMIKLLNDPKFLTEFPTEGMSGLICGFTVSLTDASGTKKGDIDLLFVEAVTTDGKSNGPIELESWPKKERESAGISYDEIEDSLLEFLIKENKWLTIEQAISNATLFIADNLWASTTVKEFAKTTGSAGVVHTSFQRRRGGNEDGYFAFFALYQPY